MAAGLDYPDWTAPQAHADAIAATGAPLLTLPGSLVSSAMVLGPGLTGSTALFTIDQPCYEIRLDPFQSGAGAAGPLLIQLTWVDVSSLTNSDAESWYIWPGTGSGGHLIFGKGPVKGAQLFLLMQNFSAGATYTVNYKIFARSHLYTRDDLRSGVRASTVSGANLPVIDPTSGLLAFRNVNLGAGLGDTTELPLYNGMIMLSANTASNTGDLTITVQDSANPNAEGLGGAFWVQKTDANGLYTGQVMLPKYQCNIRMVNGNAAAKIANYWAKIIE